MFKLTKWVWIKRRVFESSLCLWSPLLPLSLSSSLSLSLIQRQRESLNQRGGVESTWFNDVCESKGESLNQVFELRDKDKKTKTKGGGLNQLDSTTINRILSVNQEESLWIKSLSWETKTSLWVHLSLNSSSFVSQVHLSLKFICLSSSFVSQLKDLSLSLNSTTCQEEDKDKSLRSFVSQLKFICLSTLKFICLSTQVHLSLNSQVHLSLNSQVHLSLNSQVHLSLNSQIHLSLNCRCLSTQRLVKRRVFEDKLIEGNPPPRKPPPPGGFSIYYVPSSRIVCKRTPLEGFVPGS